jgi:DNA-binding beta-propeller fold protein YncE
MTRTEERLTDALDAAGRAVKGQDLRQLPAPGDTARVRRRGGWQRWLAPVAAAAAVAVIATFALIPALRHNPSAGGGGAGSVVTVGGFPTGIAVDTATNTAYVSAGEANSLSLVSTASCNAAMAASVRCANVKMAATGGSDPIGVAVDEQTQTVYVVNGGSNTVAVIDAVACNAADTAGCAAKPTLVNVGAGAEFLAVDELTNTVYVANTSAGTVSVIDGAMCDASDTSGCARKPATVAVGAGAFPIAVDPATDTVYVGESDGVAVIDGRTCNASISSGCARAPAIVPTGNEPAGIAVDDPAGTIYVSGESGTVALIDSATCDAADTSGCARPVATVTVGADPRGDAFDTATSTVYVADAGSDTVSLLNAATCNAAETSGCAAIPATFPAGASPRRVAVDPANHTVYVVNVEASTVSVVNSASCNATLTKGCPSAPPAGTSAGISAAGALRSSCSPAETEQSSGQSAAAFTGQATEVASGSVNGGGWTLWARKGMPEPGALENGGLVLGGRWYGLCAGFPNIAEMEFIDTGSRGIAYGYMALPGKLTLTMTPAGSLETPDTVRLGAASFFIADLAKSACAYKSVVLHASTPSGSAMHQLGFGSCQAGHDVAITGSDGEWGTGQGPASAPGMGLGTGPAAAGDGTLVNTQDNCTPGATLSDSGRPAAGQTASETQVASGQLAGSRWSLWSDRSVAGVDGIEDGGVVLDGRWYGLCPGFPNPAEFELVDTGQAGIVVGYVANPGDYKISIAGSEVLPSPASYRVRGGTFFIGVLPESACDYKALQLTAATSSVTDLHHLGFGSCQVNKLVAITESNGSW